MKNRILSMLLAIVMVVSLIPMTALSVSAATSGTTGECTWTFDGSTGTLTISGTGVIGNEQSWIEHVDSITSIVIENGVTDITNYAFYECASLKSVTLPTSVATIGNYAFTDCSNLESVTIPANVKKIGNSAFYGCSSLSTANYLGTSEPSSMGSYVFVGCSLTTVNVPGDYVGDTFGGLPVNKTPVDEPAVPKITGVSISDYEGNGSVTVDSVNRRYVITIPEGEGYTPVTYTVTGENLDKIPDGSTDYRVSTVGGSASVTPDKYETSTGNAVWAGYVHPIDTKIRDLTYSNDGYTTWTDTGWDIVAHMEGQSLPYLVGIGDTQNGTVTADKSSAIAGETVTLTVTPAKDYEIDTITVTDASGAPVTVTGNTFTMPEANVTATATFKATAHTVTVTPSQNGTVTADKSSAAAGETVTLTVIPEDDYEIDTITVTDASDAPVTVTNNTFTMPEANVTVTATFKATAHTVTVTPTTGGTVTADKSSAIAGETVTLTVLANDGYYAYSLDYYDGMQWIEFAEDGARLSGNGTFAIEMESDHLAYRAVFYPILTVTPSVNGAVETSRPSGSPVAPGTTVTVTVIPYGGHTFGSLSVVGGANDVPFTAAGDGKYTFTMPDVPTTVTATWTPIPAEAPDAAAYGSNVSDVRYEHSLRVLFTAKAGYTYTCQWYKNTVASNVGGTPIDGATAQAYPITSDLAVGVHYFYCVVRATRKDNGESASTATNVLTVCRYRVPTAKTGLIYNGAAQVLINAGASDASMPMEYALTASPSDVPTDGWSTELPRARDAGTYYVCYRLQGGVQDSLGCVTVEIAKKAIHITADDIRMYEGDGMPTLTFSVAGLAENDWLTTLPTLYCDVQPDRVGNYYIGIGDASAGSNYTISYLGGVCYVQERVCAGDDTCPMHGFADLDNAEWYHDGVHFCLESALMQGTGADTFAPEMTASRAMIAATLWRLEGEPVVNYAMSFTDVAQDAWYAEAVRWAASEGIVLGYGDGTFAPNDTITREQLATMLYRYEQYKGGGFVGTWMFRMDYTDIADVSEWAYEAMCYMSMHKIVTGKPDGRLDPKGEASRAEVAVMLQRYCELSQKEEEN